MNRFYTALVSAGNTTPCIISLAKYLNDAVTEAIDYEKNPLTDPAVLLLAYQIGFITNADIATDKTYHTLIDICRANADKPNLRPSEIN